MDHCTFPRYNESEIIVHVRNFLLTGTEAKNFSKTDLFPNAKPELLQMIFMRVLQSVYGIRQEDFCMIPMTFETAYPQLFEGFLPIANLFIYMERFLPFCRVHDFQFADVLNPKAKRTARFLSGIINFLSFRESRLDVYLSIENTYKSAMEKEQRLEMAVKEATTKLQKFDTVPPDQEEEFKELSQDIQELQQKLNQDYRQKASNLQEEIHQKRTEVAEKTKKVNELKLTICNLKEEQEQLKSKITESPEELDRRKDSLNQTLEKLKREKQEVTEKYEAYRDLVELFPSYQQELQLYQRKMQMQATNTDKFSTILAEIRILQDQIENSQSALKNGKTDEMSLKRMVTLKREKVNTLKIKLNRIREDTEQRKQAITEDCSKLQEKRSAVWEKMSRTQAEIMCFKAATQELNDNAEKEKIKAQEIYARLRSGLGKYHENLLTVVDTYMSAREDKISELSKMF
ncbi:kinetochore protein Nuf2 [Anolis sagrei]|uniref:kinetochore protein Nuf2 n=1 Tax=Anolis sagrei TaxID=38937 RepID=UPI00295BC1DD|nr:kinetochore protein Nuf2 [Anolis sagrei ordinatus]